LPIPVELNRPEILSDVKAAIRLPIAVKMSHYFSSFANMARALVDAGADGLVLFNRF
jgi:dihydroorotate dehydrogenase (fumarate)